MFSLDCKLASLTCVAERPVGKIKSPNSISLRPMHSQNSFHPFLCPSPPISKPSQSSLLHPTSQTSTHHSCIVSPHTPSNPQPSLLPTQTSSPHSHVIHPRKPQAGRSIIHNELLACLLPTASSHGIHLSALIITLSVCKSSLQDWKYT